MFIPPGEKKLETKTCRISGEEFVITAHDRELLDSFSPKLNGQLYRIPNPTLCPEERQKRRLCWRNESSLYHRVCDKTKKDIISMHAPGSNRVVVANDYYWSDAWHASKYKRQFDFGRPFFDQFFDLLRVVPYAALLNSNNENAQYNNMILGCKNCYMSAVCYYGTENAFFSKWIMQSKNIYDSYKILACEYCYQCVHVERSFHCMRCVQSSNCAHCMYGRQLHGCRDCFLCANLSQKQYYIYNQPYTREEYYTRMEQMIQQGSNFLMDEFQKFLLTQPICATTIVDCEACIGDCLFHSSYSVGCFEATDLDHCRYISGGEHMKNCMDGIGGQIDSSYEFNRAGLGGAYVFFCDDSIESSQVWYCSGVHHCHDCFGCSGFHHHEHHCILNTPYSVQEYETLAGKIIDHMRSTGEWGEFFPHHLSPYGYNETVAQEYFPISASQAHRLGWNWREDDPLVPFSGDPYVPLPIEKYDEQIVGKGIASKNIDACLSGTIKCTVTGRPFRIVKQELAFYIENGLELPEKHPSQRFRELITFRNERRLYPRKCSRTGVDILSTYAPERPEEVVENDIFRALVFT